jgi:hypothetical protein
MVRIGGEACGGGVGTILIAEEGGRREIGEANGILNESSVTE